MLGSDEQTNETTEKKGRCGGRSVNTHSYLQLKQKKPTTKTHLSPTHHIYKNSQVSALHKHPQSSAGVRTHVNTIIKLCVIKLVTFLWKAELTLGFTILKLTM